MKKHTRTILSLCLVLAMVLPAGTVYADSQGTAAGLGAQAHFQQFIAEQFHKGTVSLAELIDYLRTLYGGAGNQTPGQNGNNGPATGGNSDSNNNSNSNNNNNNSNTNRPTDDNAANDSANNQQAAAAASRVLTLTNQERRAQGLEDLTLSAELSRVAQAKAEDMAKNGYFSHTSPTYGSPFDMMKTFGVTYRAAAENIAKGYTTPEAVVTGWMNSSGHRANILNSTYTQLGVGYAVDESGRAYWVQMFIKP